MYSLREEKEIRVRESWEEKFKREKAKEYWKRGKEWVMEETNGDQDETQRKEVIREKLNRKISLEERINVKRKSKKRREEKEGGKQAERKGRRDRPESQYT